MDQSLRCKLCFWRALSSSILPFKSVTDVLYFGNSAALELVSVALVGPGERLISCPLPAAAAAEPP